MSANPHNVGVEIAHLLILAQIERAKKRELLDQALARYRMAIQQNDLEEAEAQRKTYLSIFPLVFTDAMEITLPEVVPISESPLTALP